jgi:hypothetical protein
MTHDYKRTGTTTLFAAIELAKGTIIAECMPQHRHQEWIKLLKKIDADTLADSDPYLIVDNDATHRHPKVKSWLKRHPRFRIHFTPTSSSWLHVIERWFRDITQNRIRNGVFHNVPQLIKAIHDYIDHHNTTRIHSSGPKKLRISSRKLLGLGPASIRSHLLEALP